MRGIRIPKSAGAHNVKVSIYGSLNAQSLLALSPGVYVAGHNEATVEVRGNEIVAQNEDQKLTVLKNERLVIPQVKNTYLLQSLKKKLQHVMSSETLDKALDLRKKIALSINRKGWFSIRNTYASVNNEGLHIKLNGLLEVHIGDSIAFEKDMTLFISPDRWILIYHQKREQYSSIDVQKFVAQVQKTITELSNHSLRKINYDAKKVKQVLSKLPSGKHLLGGNLVITKKPGHLQLETLGKRNRGSFVFNTSKPPSEIALKAHSLIKSGAPIIPKRQSQSERISRVPLAITTKSYPARLEHYDQGIGYHDYSKVFHEYLHSVIPWTERRNLIRWESAGEVHKSKEGMLMPTISSHQSEAWEWRKNKVRTVIRPRLSWCMPIKKYMNSKGHGEVLLLPGTLSFVEVNTLGHHIYDHVSDVYVCFSIGKKNIEVGVSRDLGVAASIASSRSQRKVHKVVPPLTDEDSIPSSTHLSNLVKRANRLAALPQSVGVASARMALASQMMTVRQAQSIVAHGRPIGGIDGEARVQHRVVVKIHKDSTDARKESKIHHQVYESIDPAGRKYFCKPIRVGNGIQTCLSAQEEAEGVPLKSLKTITDNLAEEFGAALGFLHRAGYAHMNLKNGNIIVSHGKIKVIDLGLSQKIPKGPEGLRTLNRLLPTKSKQKGEFTNYAVLKSVHKRFSPSARTKFTESYASRKRKMTSRPQTQNVNGSAKRQKM